MSTVINFISDPWTITIGSGVFLALLSYLGKRFFSKNQNLKIVEPPIVPSGNQQSMVVTNNIYPHSVALAQIVPPEPSPSPGEHILGMKSKARILFIEDGIFKQIDNLRTAGWQVSQIKDVTDLDCVEIRDAQIIFVDYKDVGKKFSDEQGLGIVKALKARYAQRKWVIFYSAHPFLLSVFNGGADSYLAKNSAMLEFEQKIIQGARNVLQ